MQHALGFCYWSFATVSIVFGLGPIVSLGKPPGIAAARIFTGWIPFLMYSQQC